MRVAFLTEMGFVGKIPRDHTNLRTEFCWMHTLDAEHRNIFDYENVKGYDVVFIIFPKGSTLLNAVGVPHLPPVTVAQDVATEVLNTAGETNPVQYTHSQTDYDRRQNWLRNIYNQNEAYKLPIVETLKKHNGKVCNVQEGPSWFFNDHTVERQFHFYNQLAECDVLFAHNEYDTHFYKGLFPQTTVSVIPSLMLDPNLIPVKEEKAIIGGNFARWYGGFQSYVVATEFQVPIFVPASHCKRNGEEQVPGLKHLPWVMWNDWMKQLSTFKYAVNLMPTIAAGTFSMNCAYFGIPCIGNEKVDTQARLFPELCVDVNDVHMARHLAIQLRNDQGFYDHVAAYARTTLKESVHLDGQKWLKHIRSAINE